MSEKTLEHTLVGAFDELGLALKKGIQIEKDGFANAQEAAAYLREREEIFQKFAGLQQLANETISQTITSLQEQVKGQIEQIKALGTEDKPKILTKEDILAGIGKTVRAAWKRDRAEIYEAGGCINFDDAGSEARDHSWVDPRSFVYDKEKGLLSRIEKDAMGVSKTAIGSPLHGYPDTGQYVMNPTYSRELIKYALEKSDLNGLLRRIPMGTNQIYFPNLNATTLALTWKTRTGATVNSEQNPTYDEAGKPSFGERSLLESATLAGYVPYFDLFMEDDYDANINLGQYIVEMFASAYSVEYDTQALVANSTPFVGATRATGVLVKYVDKAQTMNIQDLMDATMLIARKDRAKGHSFFFHRTIMAMLASRRTALGDFVYQDGYNLRMPTPSVVGEPAREANVLPALGEIVSGSVVGVFMNPQNIFWGDRMGVEIRRYRETSENLLHGEEFIRFRKRDAFLTTKPATIVVIKQR